MKMMMIMTTTAGMMVMIAKLTTWIKMKEFGE